MPAQVKLHCLRGHYALGATISDKTCGTGNLNHASTHFPGFGSGSVWGPFGIRSGSVRDPLGFRSGSIRDQKTHINYWELMLFCFVKRVFR